MAILDINMPGITALPGGYQYKLTHGGKNFSGGQIVEDGTCDELIDKGGSFAELVERQRPDTAG